MAAKKTTTKKPTAKTTKTTVASTISKKTAKTQDKKIAPKKTEGASFLQVEALRNKLGKVNVQSVRKTIIDHKVAFISILVVLALILLVLPHLAVAWVDNRPITIFEYYQALDSKYGKDEKQQLVAQRLVEDEARKRGVSVSDAEVENQFNQVEQQASGSANLDQLLAQQGLTESSFRTQLRLQALIKKMFSSEATVSAQEIDQYINDNKDQFPTVDDATKAQVSQQLSQQKLVSAFQDWLQTAESSNRVSGL